MLKSKKKNIQEEREKRKSRISDYEHSSKYNTIMI